MSTLLKHLFDQSTCLTPRQVKDYIADAMDAEELHAVEHHLNSCPICNSVMDGMYINKKETITTISTLNTDFLTQHFGIVNPQVHLNSIAPMSGSGKKDKAPVWRNAAITAVLLVGFAAMWILGYLKNEVSDDGPSDIKTQVSAPAAKTAGTVSATTIKNTPAEAKQQPEMLKNKAVTTKAKSVSFHYKKVNKTIAEPVPVNTGDNTNAMQEPPYSTLIAA